MTSEEIEKDQGGPLAKLAAALGEIHAAAGNQPKALDDSGVAWFVERGGIDVFSAKCTDGRMQSAFKHLARLTAGRMAFGTEPQAEDSVLLFAKGLPGSALRRIPISNLIEEGVPDEVYGDVGSALVAEVDAWITDFAAAAARDVAPRPRVNRL